MFDLSWANILHSNAFNFVFLIIILTWLFLKINLKGSFEGSRDKIANYLKAIFEDKEKSLKELERTKSEIENLPKTLDRMIDLARQNAIKIGENILNEANKQILKIRNDFQKTAENSKKSQELAVQKKLSQKALIASQAKLSKILEKQPELHRKINEDFVSLLESEMKI